MQGKLPLIQLHMILRCVFSSQYDLEAWPSPLSYRPTDVSSGVKTTRSVSNVPNALAACPHGLLLRWSERRPESQKCCRDYTHGVVDVLVLAHARQREKFGAGDKAAGVEQ